MTSIKGEICIFGLEKVFGASLMWSLNPKVLGELGGSKSKVV